MHRSGSGLLDAVLENTLS